jgi:exopolysaccharide production protein ExoZ
LVVQGWTLNYEMFFYLVFGATLLISRVELRLGLLLAAFGSLVAADAVFNWPPILSFYAQPLILDFVAGAFIGALYLRGFALPTWLAFAAIFIGFFALAVLSEHWPGWTYALRWGAPAVAIVYGALSLEPHIQGVSWARLLGDASYSIYLSQGVVLSAFGAFWIRFMGLGSVASLAAFAASALAFAVLAGLCVFYGLERPLTRLVRRMARQAPPVPLRAS